MVSTLSAMQKSEKGYRLNRDWLTRVFIMIANTKTRRSALHHGHSCTNSRTQIRNT